MKMLFCGPMNHKDQSSTLAYLKEFYNETNPSNNSWYITEGWNGTDFCQFSGLVCDETNELILGIYLESNGLIGKIPSSFGNITSLEEINFASNNIIELPDLSKMKNLTFLSIYENNIQNFAHINLDQLSNLKNLNLSSTGITSIPNLNEGLEILDISNNKIEILSQLPISLKILNLANTSLEINKNNSRFLASLTNLSALKLNFIRVSDFSFLSSLISLSVLDLDFLDIDEFPPNLYDCKNLTKLTARGNKFKVLRNNITSLKYLNHLRISNNLIESIEINEPFPSMTCLRLSKNQLNSTSLAKIMKYFPSLKHLMLSENYFTSIPPNFCSKKSNLTFLDLSFNYIDSLDGFNCSDNLNSLEFLNLQGNKINSFPPFMKNLFNLRNLYVSNNNLTSLQNFPPGITILRAKNNSLFNSTEVSSFLRKDGYPFSFLDLKQKFYFCCTLYQNRY